MSLPIIGNMKVHPLKGVAWKEEKLKGRLERVNISDGIRGVIEYKTTEWKESDLICFPLF